jgi:hypothetical protein
VDGAAQLCTLVFLDISGYSVGYGDKHSFHLRLSDTSAAGCWACQRAVGTIGDWKGNAFRGRATHVGMFGQRVSRFKVRSRNDRLAMLSRVGEVNLCGVRGRAAMENRIFRFASLHPFQIAGK